MTFCTCNANPIRVKEDIIRAATRLTGEPGLDARHKASTSYGSDKASISREMGDKQLLTFSAPVSVCDACQTYTSVVHRCEYLRQKLLTLGRLLSSALW